MFSKNFSLVCLVLFICLLTSCPKNGDNANSESTGEGIAVSTPSQQDTTAADSGSSDSTGGTEATNTDSMTATNSDETAEDKPIPQAWSIDGIKKGDPIKLSADVENTIVFKYELPKECHWNEDNPLGMVLTFAPDGIVVEPLEFIIPKPADVPSELVFKVKGVKTDGSGELAFDVMAYFCSDEGFCMRKNDTVSLPFVTSNAKEPTKNTVIYKISTD